DRRRVFSIGGGAVVFTHESFREHHEVLSILGERRAMVLPSHKLFYPVAFLHIRSFKSTVVPWRADPVGKSYPVRFCTHKTFLIETTVHHRHHAVRHTVAVR